MLIPGCSVSSHSLPHTWHCSSSPSEAVTVHRRGPRRALTASSKWRSTIELNPPYLYHPALQTTEAHHILMLMYSLTLQGLRKPTLQRHLWRVVEDPHHTRNLRKTVSAQVVIHTHCYWPVRSGVDLYRSMIAALIFSACISEDVGKPYAESVGAKSLRSVADTIIKVSCIPRELSTTSSLINPTLSERISNPSSSPNSSKIREHHLSKFSPLHNLLRLPFFLFLFLFLFLSS